MFFLKFAVKNPWIFDVGLIILKMHHFHDDLIFKEESYEIIGLSMKVHNRLGNGFREVVYKDALEIEFLANNINYKREQPFPIVYEGIQLRHHFIADFLIYDSIILEIKAATQIHYDNFRQTLNYLKASQVQLGLLINFGEPRLNYKRIVCTY